MHNFYNNNIKKKKKLHVKPSSFDDYITKKEFQKGTPVWLNIYHLTCLNYFLQIIGVGIYHTAIEIESQEYSFGATKEDVPGFYINEIGQISKLLKLKEKIYMGNTIYTKNNIDKLLALESPFWMGRTYDPFLKNCNHFTKRFLKVILFKNINYPVYINRICKYAQVFSSFYPPIKRLYGNLHRRDTCSSVSYLAEEINYFLRTKSIPKSGDEKDIAIDKNDRDSTLANLNLDNLKDDEKYFSEKIKKKGEINNESISEKKSENNSMNEEIISRLNIYRPKLIQIMNKDPYLFSLDYSSIYTTQIQGDKIIDIKIESIYNFIKNLQDTNDKLIQICNINQNINTIFNINYLNFSKNQYKFDKSLDEYNKLSENIETCSFLLKTINEGKYFHEKSIIINFDEFIKNNYDIFQANLIIGDKIMNIETFLVLKILHMRNFIYFMNKNFEKQKEMVERILIINQNDFYGLFSLAYIRLVQSNIPESSELINSLLSKKEIANIPFYNYILNYMKNLINNY